MNGSVEKYRVSTKHPDTGRYDRWRIRWDLSPDPYTGNRRQGSQRGFATRKAADAACWQPRCLSLMTTRSSSLSCDGA